jgi:hypothetical protein
MTESTHLLATVPRDKNIQLMAAPTLPQEDEMKRDFDS